MNDPVIQTPERERRMFIGQLELREAPAGSKSPGTLVGYAAVYEQLSLDLGMFREKLARGAFDDSLKSDDVRGLKNHDENLLLGRSTSSTLRMTSDEIGLRYEIDLPDTSAGRDTAEEVRRGDLTGCSFSFTTDVDQWDFSGQIPIRTVQKVKRLYDVGPVTFPAYEQTSVACRSFREACEARKAPAEPTPIEPPVSLQLAKARQRHAEAF